MRMPIYFIVLPLLGFTLGLSGCGDSQLAQQQYTQGVASAQAAACDCDPFFSNASENTATSAQVSPQWADGYINACVDLRRSCDSNSSENKLLKQ